MKDIYGDHGLISLVCLKLKPEKILLLDTFLISCRILGRYSENWILNEILTIVKKNKINKLIAEFTPTKKNDIAKNFLTENNFKKISGRILSKNKKMFKLMNSPKKTELFLYEDKEKIKYLNVYA
jgi:predicted enzyme involved in methoxymalonyl-ACP biosynthesis